MKPAKSREFGLHIFCENGVVNGVVKEHVAPRISGFYRLRLVEASEIILKVDVRKTLQNTKYPCVLLKPVKPYIRF